MKRLGLLYKPGSHQERQMDRLAHGVQDMNVHRQLMLPNVAVWGWKRGRRLHRSRLNVLVLERGYLGDRMAWTSLGWNGLNGYATFYNTQVPEDRWARYWQDGMRPWKGDWGDYVLFCGQVTTDASLYDCPSYAQFVEQELRKLVNAYGRVVYRPHPLNKDPNFARIPPQVEILDPTKTTLQQDLERARAVVAWSSNSLVEALYAGVPAWSNSAGSMVHEYFNPAKPFDEPDREDWGRKLAYCQWSREEISAGIAWQHIKQGVK
jgi:hypothetical protein